MTNQPQPENNAEITPQSTQSSTSRVLHSLEELPASVGQVSSGLFGAVSRRDHTSWKSKCATDPGYWCGRVDSAIGEHVREKPVHKVAILFGIGLLMGLVARSTGSLARD